MNEVLKAAQAQLEASRKAASAALATFPKSAVGLTPDAVKATAEWKAAYRAYQAAHEALRQFNAKHATAMRRLAA